MLRPVLVIASVALFAASCGSPGTEAPVGGEEASVATLSAPPVSGSSDVQTYSEAQTSPEREDPQESDSAEEEENVEPSEESSSDEPIIAKETGYPGPVAFAIADLANRLGFDESAITLVSFDAVVWPDGGLGCPQPDMAYTQVPVDGALIVLLVDGREYRYHSGGVRDPFLCLTG
jgi:hypothetical protein